MADDFVDQPPARIRKDPLGPVTLNQAHTNLEVLDGLVLREHFDDGQHNALEVPWIVGTVPSGGTTGYLFDTAYGGGTIARPATGELTVSAVSGVIGSVTGPSGSVPAASALANVSDSNIATYPFVVEVELVSATSIKARTRYMTSTLGSPGNTWSTIDAGVDLAIHAQKQPIDVSLLASHLTKVRHDYLTETATDWSALASNQGIVRKAMMLEHTSAGAHNVNRIAKALGWFRPAAGPTFSTTISHGVTSVSRISSGVIEVTLDFTLSSTNAAACFAQAQPATADELVIICGRCTSTTKFRFYQYVYSVAEDKWDRGERPFCAVMFGTPA